MAISMLFRPPEISEIVLVRSEHFVMEHSMKGAIESLGYELKTYSYSLLVVFGKMQAFWLC